jgi:hypothetical protein
MNFGHKIGIFYGLFVIFMISLVTLCIKQKDVTLVSDDYYKKEIAYQEEIEKHRNTGQLASAIQIAYASDKQEVSLSFPEDQKGAIGKIQFYRPSDARKDVTLALALNETATQQIPVARLAKGLWVVKIEWEKAGKAYLKEQKIVL